VSHVDRSSVTGCSQLGKAGGGNRIVHSQWGLKFPTMDLFFWASQLGDVRSDLRIFNHYSQFCYNMIVMFL
jgi:hypothetical protein